MANSSSAAAAAGVQRDPSSSAAPVDPAATAAVQGLVRIAGPSPTDRTLDEFVLQVRKRRDAKDGNASCDACRKLHVKVR